MFWVFEFLLGEGKWVCGGPHRQVSHEVTTGLSKSTYTYKKQPSLFFGISWNIYRILIVLHIITVTGAWLGVHSRWLPYTGADVGRRWFGGAKGYDGRGQERGHGRTVGVDTCDAGDDRAG